MQEFRRLVSGHDRRGAVGVMFAMMLLPLLGLIALSIDFGMRARAQTVVNAAADSAVLMAATSAASAYQAGQQNWQSAGQTAGLNFFNAQIADVNYLQTGQTSLQVAQDPSAPNTFTASLQYTGSMRTYFAHVFGQGVFAVDGGSATTTSVPSYVDIHVLMDNSSSMLIGATQQDMDTLSNAVQHQYSSWDSFNPEGQNQTCAFACHFSNTYQQRLKQDGSGYATVPNDFYGVALLTGVTLRLNVVTGAVANVISTIQSKQPAGQTLYQVGLYSFNDPSKTNLNASAASPFTVYALGSDFATARSDAQNLQVPLTYDNNYEPDTDIDGSLAYVNTKIPQSTGAGTATNHKEYLFLVTDGVEDYIDSHGSRQLRAIDPSVCQTLKSRNVQIYVLYTTYIPIPSNLFYSENVASFADNGSPTTLAQNLQSCASSASTFFSATSTTDISNQMQNMLQAALGAAGRLTQ